MTTTSTKPIKLPWWLKPANRVVIALNRLGLSIGSQYILTVAGRKSGSPYSTPVSLLTVKGQRYICTVGEMGWVKNARAARMGTLTRGRNVERVSLVELPIDQRGAILYEFPRQVPHGVPFFTKMIGLPNDPQAFADAASQCPVFHVQAMTSTAHSD